MILATAGHIDHGKTALVRALTGVDADRLPEEKRRGLTIDLGFVYTTLPDGTVLGFVDVPGHERFLPNMLAGVLSIDRVLLIVAADDGPRPQTLEHLEILQLIGIGEVSGVVTKIDRTSPERSETVAGELRTLLADAGFAAAPIFAVSSRSGDGIAALTTHLQQSARDAARQRAERRPAGYFRLPIDRAFTLPGIGMVVTGTVAAGAVATGDRLCLGPSGVTVRVRGLHAHNRSAETAVAGDRCALNLVGDWPDGGEPGRGDWVIDPALHAPAERLDLSLRVSPAAPAPLRDGLPVHFHLGTADIVGRIAVLGGRTIAAGETGLVQIELQHPVEACHGDRAVLRDHGQRRTLGGGHVLDPAPPRRGRARPARRAWLEAGAAADPAAALARLLAVSGVVDLHGFATARNLTPTELDALVAAGGFQRVGSARAPVAVTPARLAELCERLTATLDTWHAAQPDALGPSRSLLLRRLQTEAPAAALDAALAASIAAGTVLREGAVLRNATHQPKLTRADERLWDKVQPLLAAGDLRPPRVRELAAALTLEPDAAVKFLRRVERFGRVAKIADNRFYLPETVTRLAAIAGELADAAPEGFTAIAFKDRSGIGRNLTIEVLEYLDAIGVTRRNGNLRTVLRGAAEVFGAAASETP